MPELSLTNLLILFIFALALGAGWTLGCWLMNRILKALFGG